MSSASDFINTKLQERQEAGNYRSLKGDNHLIDFCSNDYLGFARSLVLAQMVADETIKYQPVLNGSSGSRLLTGNSAYAEELENAIPKWHGAEAGLIFNSGYDANLGLLSSLPQRGDTIILDELAHASIIDGARLSHANRYSFRHNDPDSLEGKLKLAKGRCYVVVESVYSMDGDMAPLTEILTLTERYGAGLIVDEAHAIGVFNLGLVNQLQLQQRVLATVATFGKAMGGHGAIILGSAPLKAYLINFARSFIYTTAAPFHQLATIKMAYQLLMMSADRQDALQQLISYFNTRMAECRYDVIPSNSAIQCLLINSNKGAKVLALHLYHAGIDVRAILSPTVPAGTERLRICLHAYNSVAQVDLLINTINTFNHE